VQVQQRSPAERGVEPVSRLALLLGGTDMAVDVRSNGVGRVAQVLLDDLRVRPRRQQEARRRVTQRVQVDPRRPARSASASNRRRTLRGSSGVPTSVVNQAVVPPDGARRGSVVCLPIPMHW
jgi:hypothetical protein